MAWGLEVVGALSKAARAARLAEEASAAASIEKGLQGLALTPWETLSPVKPMRSQMFKKDTTVMRPKRLMFPDVYSNPKQLAADAASRVAPEDPLLKQLFNVNRGDLAEIGEHGARKGNVTEQPFNSAPNAKGARHIKDVMNPRNDQRLQDIITEAKDHPELYDPMASWYVMDPAYKRLEELVGPDAAKVLYTKFNAFTSMASPGSEVLTELNRGTAANWLNNEGRFDDFLRYAGKPAADRGAKSPTDMRDVQGHIYHISAQGKPMSKFIESGDLSGMKSAKVPTYNMASGVPETGFQTAWPVGDAHFSRIVGLPDVRAVEDAASASVPEMVKYGPHWRDKVAAPMGLEAVPAQAVLWGAGSGATGVSSQIGAGKLELLAGLIGKTARRLNITPEQARDMVLMGKTHAGNITPEMAAVLAGVAGTAAVVGSQIEPDPVPDP